jgi:hypothetical protein
MEALKQKITAAWSDASLVEKARDEIHETLELLDKESFALRNVPMVNGRLMSG